MKHYKSFEIIELPIIKATQPLMDRTHLDMGLEVEETPGECFIDVSSITLIRPSYDDDFEEIKSECILQIGGDSSVYYLDIKEILELWIICKKFNK